jgi:outer membrane receptor protein involved in Fe transport
MGLEYAPVELARVGVVTRVIRARNATADEPLARIPSSIVGGYVELGAPGGHPYLRWVTLGRLARNRFADSVDERETSYSVVSDIEAGGRFRRLRFALGVRNLGDRRIRDHVDGRIENVVPLNAPGRQLTIRVRYLVD